MPVSIQEPQWRTEESSAGTVDGRDRHLHVLDASEPPSPTDSRRTSKIRKYKSNIFPSSSDLSACISATRDNGEQYDERTPLISPRISRARGADERQMSKPRLSRHQSATGSLGRSSRHHSRANSWSQRLVKALRTENIPHSLDRESKGAHNVDERVWYDQFTSTDWVHDSIANAFRVKELRSRKDVRGRLKAFFDGAQGWVLSALIGVITACIAYVVDVGEVFAFDLKYGFCSDGWYYKSEKACCPNGSPCDTWESWSSVINHPLVGDQAAEFFVYVLLVVAFAAISCLLTLTTKTVVSSTYRISTLDENLGALDRSLTLPDMSAQGSPPQVVELSQTAPMIYYPASGSGVAEVKVILSGFVLHGFLGLKVLLLKTLGLVLSVASGLSIGKEGPFVHIAACVGNIACRVFPKYDRNDSKRREMLSAAAAAGVTVAFGAPIGGVLFILEESPHPLRHQRVLFRTFFCCIIAALTLKFLDPYGTQKIVMFETKIFSSWHFFEMVPFVLLGMLGGAAGALFIKITGWWAKNFRRLAIMKRWPLIEVLCVALLTALLSYWDPLTNSAVAKLLSNLASPCVDNPAEDALGLCPKNKEEILETIGSLANALLVKGLLTTITFGIKVPAGIYVPSMVVGGLLGRIAGHLVQWLVLSFPHAAIFEKCAADPSSTSCIVPGIYALIAAGSTMAGTTRLGIALVVILFELTGSLDYVLPFSLAILVANWTADAIEPLSIYDLLIRMNSYPFLNDKTKPVFTSDLGDIVPRGRPERVIDISASPLVPAVELRQKLELLHDAGEVDGGLPVIRDELLVGLIPAPDLEFALDSLPQEVGSLCQMTTIRSFDEDEDEEQDPNDFTRFIDPAPMTLDIKAPMDLVYECFAKLGLRYICVVNEGTYYGVLHRKMFVHYVRKLEEDEH